VKQANCVTTSSSVRVLVAVLTWASAGAAWAAGEDVRVKGRVVDGMTAKPVTEAVVFVRDWRTITDADGRFFIDLPPGVWTLEASASRFQPSTLMVDACPRCAPEVEILMIPRDLVRENVVVIASANGSSDPIATTVVRPVEVLNVAGAFENVFRVLQTLPGVVSTDEVTNRMAVRGGGPDQNLTVMDGVEIHNPYRLFGLVSAFNPETVEGFEFSAGAFSARHGDRLSSILVIDSRAGTVASPLKGSLGLSLTDTNAILEGRLPRSTGSFLVTGRRTWYDLVARSFTDNELPAFNDLQGKLQFDLREGRSLTLSGLRSREQSDLEFDEDLDSGAVATVTHNDLASASLFLPLGRRGSSRTIAAHYENTDDIEAKAHFQNTSRRSNAPQDEVAFSFDELAGTLDTVVRDRSLRQELTYQLAAGNRLETGFEFHRLGTETRYDVTFGRPGEDLVALPPSLTSSRTDDRSGAWLIDRVRATSWLDIEAGLRFDSAGINGRKELAPRLSASARLGASTRLRTAFGIHTQSPGYEKLSQGDFLLDFSADGKLALENERARHLIVSLERDLAPGLTVRAEGFYRRFQDLIIGNLESPAETQARVAFYDFPEDLRSSIPDQAQITNIPVNQGRGTAYGFDVFLVRRQVSPSNRLSGWASYTFTHAQRDCYGRTCPFQYEQPHALSVVGSFRLSPRFEASLTARLASGFPRTLPLGLRVAGIDDSADGDGDGDRSEIVPDRDREGRLVYAIDYGSIDNLYRGRNPLSARVDLRATFVPRWGKGRWRFYVDVLNALKRSNGPVTDELEHDPNSDRPRIVEKREGGFPLLPSFGIHVRF